MRCMWFVIPAEMKSNLFEAEGLQELVGKRGARDLWFPVAGSSATLRPGISRAAEAINDKVASTVVIDDFDDRYAPAV